METKADLSIFSVMKSKYFGFVNDTNHINQQMSKDTSNTSQKGQSSQYTKSGPTKP